MKFLAVHPSPLMYTKIYLRLEPLGLELVAQAVRRAGHEVQLIDLQVESHQDYVRMIERWKPDVVAFSCNYLANVQEIVDLAKLTKDKLRNSVVVIGGHSASFVAREFLQHAEGAIDCVLKGEGEAALPPDRRESVDSKLLYIHRARGRQGRALDDSTEQFVENTRMGVSV